MAFVALYRKFRPQTFAQVVGQEHVTRTLKNEIKNGRIGHAYLFTGTRGTGKTSVAKIFARAINCENPRDGEPCNECKSCKEALQGTFLDIAEVDAASNTHVEDVRRIIEEVRYTPVKGKYKVYIIDEAHMLSQAAFNAFLKTLEEPPAYAVFILATTEPHKLPVTILSRCQRYDFKRIPQNAIEEAIFNIAKAEGAQAEEAAIKTIARAGDGSMRDSVSLLDKCIAQSLGEPLTYALALEALGEADTDVFSRLYGKMISHDAGGALDEIEKAYNSGADFSRFVTDFIWYLRNILVCREKKNIKPEDLGVSQSTLSRLEKDGEAGGVDELMRYIKELSLLLDEMRLSSSKRVLTEMTVIRLSADGAACEAQGESNLRAERNTELKPKETEIKNAEETDSEVQSENAGSHISENEKKSGADSESVTYAGNEIPYIDKAEIENKAAENNEGESKDKEKSAVLSAPKALSEAELAAACWNDIIARCDGQRLQRAVSGAKPLANGDALDVFGNGTIYVNILKENVKTLEDIIFRVTGNNVPVRIAQGTPRAAGGKAFAENKEQGFTETAEKDAAKSRTGSTPESPAKHLDNSDISKILNNFEIGTEEN